MPAPASRSFGPVTVYFGEKNGKYPDGNQVIVRGSDATLAFDTPLVSRRLLPELRRADLIVLGHVHEDHTVSLGALAEVPVFAPEEDLAALRSFDGLLAHYGYSPAVNAGMREYVERKFSFQPRPDARGYGRGAEWDLGGVRVRALHMPGHMGGHSVLMIEPEGVAFIGDIDLTGFGPYYGDGCSSLARFMDSLERMRDLSVPVWITSHHKGVVMGAGEQRAMLEKFAGRIRERESAICAELANSPRTLAELTAHRFLYPRDYHEIFVDDAERKTIQEHLNLLAAEGRVLEEGGRYRLAERA